MNTRRRAFVGAACGAGLVLALAAPVVAVESTGEAVVVGSGETAKKAATKAALKKACESACGDFLRTQEHVRNRDQIFDRVMAEPTTFAASIQATTIEDTAGQQVVRVRAEVSPERFTDQWKLTYCLVNSPRLMVVVTEERDGAAQSLRLVQAAIERHFLLKGFRLVDKSQFSDVKEARLKEAALADDLATVASVARDFGSELVVVGQAKTEKGGAEKVGDFEFQFCSANAVVKVVQTDSAALVVSERASARAGSRSASTAADKALEQLASQIAERLWKGCQSNWDQMIGGGGFRCELLITGIPATGVLQVERALKAIEGVKEVNLRTMRANAAQFEVVSSHSAKDLFALIVEKKAVPGLEITGITENVIQARWTKESI